MIQRSTFFLFPSCRRTSTYSVVVFLFLLLSLSSWARRGSVVVWSLKLKNNETSCEIVTFIPFSDLREGLVGNHNDDYGYGNWPDADSLAAAGYSLLASAEMARRHFNERNDEIVSDIDELTRDCTITLDGPLFSSAGGTAGNNNSKSNNASSSSSSALLYLNSAYDRHWSMRQLVELQSSSVLRGAVESPHDALCAVVGPVDQFAVEGVASLVETMEIPVITYESVSQRLEDVAVYPNLIRVASASVRELGTRLALYLQRGDVGWQRDYVGVIYDQGEFGEQYLIALEEMEPVVHYELVKEHFIENENETLLHALDEMKDSGYKTVVLATDRSSILSQFAELASQHFPELLDGSVFWILLGQAVTPAYLQHARHEPDSPMDRLLRGAALFTNHDAFLYYGETDPFLRAWRQQATNENFVDELNDLVPYNPQTGERYYQASSSSASYFEEEMPTEYASFLYDAIMLTGIGACQAAAASSSTRQQRQEATSNNSSSASSSPVVSLHHEGILDTQFVGASGLVRFRVDDKRTEDDNPAAADYPNGRHSEDVDFGVYNIRPIAAADNSTNRYEVVLTSLYSNRYTYLNTSGAWKNVPGTVFIFADGTTNEPVPKIAVFDHHYLSRGAQAAGFVLVGLSLFVSLSSAGWVVGCRGHHIVKAGQPEFLILLCLGSVLVGVCTLCISFDEGKGWTQDALTKACSAFPWLFVLGYLTMYGALFVKLWRLDKLMQTRRRVVKVHQVALPYVILIAASLIVLIAWHVLDPLSWVVRVVRTDPFETYGECQSTVYGLVPFVVPLGLLFAVIIVSTAIIAWRLRAVQTELSESRWIFFGILTHLQTWAVGIPILIITDGVSKEAFYVMLAGLAFIFSTSLVAFVIWPRMYTWFRSEYGPAKKKKTSTFISVSSTGGGGHTRVSGIVTGSVIVEDLPTTTSLGQSVLGQRQASMIRQRQQQQQQRGNNDTLSRSVVVLDGVPEASDLSERRAENRSDANDNDDNDDQVEQQRVRRSLVQRVLEVRRHSRAQQQQHQQKEEEEPKQRGGNVAGGIGGSMTRSTVLLDGVAVSGSSVLATEESRANHDDAAADVVNNSDHVEQQREDASARLSTATINV